MLHNLVVASASAVLGVLQEQIKKDIAVNDLVNGIPDDIEEQERILQVLYTLYIIKFVYRLSLCPWRHSNTIKAHKNVENTIGSAWIQSYIQMMPHNVKSYCLLYRPR